MLTSLDFYHKYGHPSEKKNLIMWDVPAELEIGIIPKKIYCNLDIVAPLSAAFRDLIKTNRVIELKTWDGCYNFRPIRGYEEKYKHLMEENLIEQAMKYVSIHSWGGAVDVNAFENGLGQEPKLTRGFVECFTKNGFMWGGLFTRKDGMHFQLAHI